MAKAHDVARLFIEIAASRNKDGGGDLMTNLRLQKLLYFAQGWHLARYGKPLFNEPIDAWKYGPVVPAVYYEYNENGKNGIDGNGDIDLSVFDENEYALILDVLREYDKFSTNELVSLSHVPNAPWSQTKQSSTIPQNEIQAYFAGKQPLPSFDDILDDYPVEVL